MFHIIFIDAFGVIDEEAFEHMELSLSHAAVDNGRECNAISNENQSRSRFRCAVLRAHGFQLGPLR
jgi:hypothetical protein